MMNAQDTVETLREDVKFLEASLKTYQEIVNYKTETIEIIDATNKRARIHYQIVATVGVLFGILGWLL